jgi:glyoxylate reductase
MKPRVFVTRALPEEAMNILQEHLQCRIWEEADIPVPRDVLLKEAKAADGLYTLLTEKVDEELLSLSPRLKVIANMAVGYDNIDIAAARKRGIVVTNTPGVLNETTADLTFALMMATARRLVEAAEFVKQGNWKTWSPMQLTGPDIYGATLGVIGMGRIGEAVVRRAKGFDMNIMYYNRNRKPEAEQELGIVYASMDELLQQSDFVVVLTPLTPETRHLIGARELSMMKPSAVLINTSRGPVVDEQALYDALRQKTIWAAGLDVFEQEPIGPDHPLLQLENLVALPHIGSASIATRRKMAVMAAENLVSALTGKEPPNRVV